MIHKILIVDDEMPTLRLLKRFLRQDFHCLTALSGAEAIELLSQHDVAIMISDQQLPDMSGIELLRQTAELRPHMARILLTGFTDAESLVEAMNCGLVHRFITRPWNNEDLKQKLDQALAEYESNRKRHALKLANDRLQAKIVEMKLGVANALDALLRTKDEYSSEHSNRVATLSTMVAEHMGLTDEERSDLFIAAVLHRVGLIATSDELLWQTRSLYNVGSSSYQDHAERGARMLSMVPELRNVADIVLLHHENLDGSGYPRGLKGEQIPIACRIMRVVDEFDLLTQPRSRSRAVSAEQALELLWNYRNTHFDPKVLEVLSSFHQLDTSCYVDSVVAVESAVLIDEPINELDVVHVG